MTTSGNFRNEYSYESARTPYRHDPTRGQWSSVSDFYFASIAHAFGILNLTIIPLLWAKDGALTSIIVSICFTFIYIVPVFFLQSSIGQFSSTGFLSVYRISPMFKGVGYVILILNITSTAYYSAMATYPLIYFFASFIPDLPWMSCNHTWNTENCTIADMTNNETTLFLDLYHMNSAPMEFFRQQVLRFEENEDDERYYAFTFAMSWPIAVTLIPVWILIALSVKDGIKSISRLCRYSMVIGMVLFMSILLRVLFLPDIEKGLQRVFVWNVDASYIVPAIVYSPFLTCHFLGYGWGIALTLASYNKFKTNVTRYSVALPFTMLGLSILGTLFIACIAGYYVELFDIAVMRNHLHHLLEMAFVIFAHFCGTFEASNLWSIMFFGMIFLFELCAVAVQVFAVCSALFDEFIVLRPYKMYFSLSLCFGLYFASLLYATRNAYIIFHSMLEYGTICTLFISFVELMVVLWVYGRMRFQNDVAFMLGQPFASWKFWTYRFVTPIIVLFSLVIFTIFSVAMALHGEQAPFGVILGLSTKFLPWILIPGYMIYKLVTATGTVKRRFQKCTRPNDWYPADAEHRQQYEIATNLGDGFARQLIEEESHDI